MKKALLYVLAACLLVLPLHSAAVDEPGLPEDPASEVLAWEYEPGSVPAEVDVACCAAPLLRAALLAMLNRDCAAYDPADSQLVWESLYNLLSICGQLDERSQYEGEYLVFPSETLRDYAVSLVPDLSALEEPPADLADRLTWREESDLFYVVCGCDDQCALEVSSPVRTEDGLCLSGFLVHASSGAVLADFRAELAPAGSLLGFTLKSMELL